MANLRAARSRLDGRGLGLIVGQVQIRQVAQPACRQGDVPSDYTLTRATSPMRISASALIVLAWRVPNQLGGALAAWVAVNEIEGGRVAAAHCTDREREDGELVPIEDEGLEVH
jgi:hypothetical protein